MDTLTLSLILLLFSPALILIMHVISSRTARYFKWQVSAQKLALVCIVLGNIPMGLLEWSLVLRYLDLAGQIWGAAYCILTYNAIGHIYFHLFNMTETSIRVRLIREIAVQEQTIDEVIDRYNPSNSVGVRLQRLQDIGVVKKTGDRYFLQTRWLYYVGVVCRAWGDLLGFNIKDNGYIAPVKEVKHPLWYHLRNLVESNPYSWFFTWKLIHNLPFLLPHDKSYLAIRHFGLVPGDLILDVGANDGISALSFYHINPKVNMFSIDPNSLHETQFKKLKKNHLSFNYRIMGAGSERGSLTLYTPKYRSIYLHTFSSGSELQTRTTLSNSFGQRVSAECEMIVTQTEIIPLDELALAPKVIKIDVEGFEYSVLKGAKNTIIKYCPFIIIEVEHNDGSDIIQFFHELNYVLLDYDYKRNTFQKLNSKSDCASMSRNHIAAPAEKLSNLPIN
jgi:FkbM family methyltransferase